MDLVERLKRFLWNRKHNYKLTFNSPPGQKVLADLAVFCRANVSVFHMDQRATDVAIGRNEVWRRICNHLHLTEAELYTLVSGEME